MSEAFFHRSVAVTARAREARTRPLPIGIGLLIGAIVSAVLWAGVVAGLLTLFG
jgi:hypothetical protein